MSSPADAGVGVGAGAGAPRLGRPSLGPPRATGTLATARRRGVLLRHPGVVAGYLRGHRLRRTYAARLAVVAPGAPAAPHAVAADVVSFSSERDLPEQVASLRSFLAYAGVPRRWTVASDGSHTPASRALLRSIHPCVAVRDWTELAGDRVPDAVRRAAERHPLGRKLALLTGLEITRTTITVDADVLFAPGARALASELTVEGSRPRYQRDCFTVLDERIVTAAEQAAPTNTGFLVLHRPLPFGRGVAALERLLGDPAFFREDGAWAEQAVVHLALRDAGGVALDPARYVIRGDDVLRYGELDADAPRVMRHYAGPTRSMFWLRQALQNDPRGRFATRVAART